MNRRTTALGAIIMLASITGISAFRADAGQIGPEAFEDPITFDFSDLAYGTLGAGLPSSHETGKANDRECH